MWLRRTSAMWLTVSAEAPHDPSLHTPDRHRSCSSLCTDLSRCPLGLEGGDGVSMTTSFLLLAQYSGAAVIPVEWVCRDYFSHLKPDQFVRLATTGEIAIPVVRMTSSQKAAKGVHLQDLADYLDRQREAARKELEKMRAN